MNRLLIRDCIFNTDQIACIFWDRDENVLIVSLNSGKYKEFKDFLESEKKTHGAIKATRVIFK